MLVFGEPVGILERDEVVESIRSAPRWEAVELHDTRAIELGAEAVLLVYRAAARLPDREEPYTTAASSLYVREDGAWRLTFHQQSVPLSAP